MNTNALLRLALLAPLLTPLTAKTALGQGGFQAGDLYLSTATAGGLCSQCGGLVRVDPLTGVGTTVVNFSATTRAVAYDPFRDRLVLCGDLGAGMGVYAVDSLGIGQKLTGTSPRGIAAVGDGRVYLIGGFTGGIPGQFDRVGYLDAAGNLMMLQDAASTGDFFLSTGTEKSRDMIYDPLGNALFVAFGVGAGGCAGGNTGAISIFRIPLTPAGNQVAGPVTCTQYDVTVGIGDEAPSGFSRGPEGDLILVVDTNGNDAQARVLQIDPLTESITPFAVTGSYLGAAATNAGSFSSLRNGVLVLNTLTDKLHLFTPGSGGTGLVFGSGNLSPGGSSAELVRMVEIVGSGIPYGLTANSSQISLSAGGSQTLSIFAGPAQAGRVYLVLGSLSGWNPGTNLGALNLPLNFDNYLLYTLNNPSAAPLSGNPGILNPQGQASAAVTFPAGSNPNFAGLKLHHAALAIDNFYNPTWISNPAPLLLVP